MRGAVVAALAAAAVVGAPSLAPADPLPTGRLSVQVGGKAATGGFASRLGFGIGWGLEAAYQPMRPDQSVGFGASWSASWSYYGDGSARISSQLATVELDAGLRIRVPLGVRRRQVLFLGGGAALVRMNEPPVEDGERSYVGGWAAAGVEGMFRQFPIGLEARYVLARTDDGTIGLWLSAGFGS